MRETTGQSFALPLFRRRPEGVSAKGRYAKFDAMKRLFTFLTLVAALAETAAAGPKKILFFSKSSGFEHSAITWKNGRPGHAEKILLKIGESNNWEFTFSKDGSLFSKDYLKQFDAVFFYTTGFLTTAGADGNPPMSPEGKQALFDYVRAGHGFLGTHSASDTFHVGEEKSERSDGERWKNHGENADPYIRMLGGEFIKHGAQQAVKNTVIDPKFPGFAGAGADFTLKEEWYSLKDFRDDLHVLTVIDAPSMKGAEYERPPYPTTWARREGKGRVWFSAMGHREDMWTNPLFQQILTGGLKWALDEVKADVTPNIKQVAPGAWDNPKFPTPSK
jgi:uncharacterized protein